MIVKCVLGDGSVVDRRLAYVEQSDDMLEPSKFYPELFDGEQVIWMVGDTRPHIVEDLYAS